MKRAAFMRTKLISMMESRVCENSRRQRYNLGCVQAIHLPIWDTGILICHNARCGFEMNRGHQRAIADGLTKFQAEKVEY